MPIFSSIKNAIRKVARTISAIVTSTPSTIITTSLGTVASVAGFILAFHTFIDAIDTTAKVYAALIAPAGVFILIAANATLKHHFFTKTASKFTTDKQAIDAAYEHLNKDSLLHDLNHDLPDSYQQILALLNNHESTPITPYVTEAAVAAALLSYLEDKTDLSTLVKYSTGSIDLVLAATSGAGTVFISFILPMIFKNALENKDLQKAAVAVAVPYGAYTTTASLANTIKKWGEWERKKTEVNASVDKFCRLYDREPHPNEGENAQKMVRVMTLWREKRRVPEAAVNEVRIPMPQQVNP